MSGIQFDIPWMLLGLAAFIPIAVADSLSARRRRIAAMLPPGMRRRFFLSTAFSRLSLAFLIVAISGPRWGEGETSGEYRAGMDVVFAVDVSRSMEVPDGNGLFDGSGNGTSRLDRGLEITAEAAASLPGTRLGAAISRGRGVLAVPLTWDSTTVMSFLEALGSSSMTGTGTNLEALVNAAAGAFSGAAASGKVIVLVSDGEELSGDLGAAISGLRRENIELIALATGSDDGGTFPGGGDTVSRRNSRTMRTAASQSNGLYIDANDPDAAKILSARLSASTALQEAGGDTEYGGRRKSRWFIFAALSLLALAGSKALLLGKRQAKQEGEK